jgi:putative FmdB family regulatory protein
MPQYEFFCKKCRKIFTAILTLAEHGKGEFVCPHCKSRDVEQRPAAFHVVTSKKS